jgi:hypothetical protein
LTHFISGEKSEAEQHETMNFIGWDIKKKVTVFFSKAGVVEEEDYKEYKF